jgi:hypothetical protein
MFAYRAMLQESVSCHKSRYIPEHMSVDSTAAWLRLADKTDKIKLWLVASYRLLAAVEGNEPQAETYGVISNTC